MSAADQRLIAGLWSKYLHVQLKHAKRPLPLVIIEQHKDTFYLGAAAMYSLFQAALIHSPESLRWWMEDIKKELHEHIGEDCGRQNVREVLQ